MQVPVLDNIGVDKLVAVWAARWAACRRWRGRKLPGSRAPYRRRHTPRLGAQAIGFNEVGRQAILADPNFRRGDYYGKKQPDRGLAIARMVGHITYLSDESMRAKFGRRLQDARLPRIRLRHRVRSRELPELPGPQFVNGSMRTPTSTESDRLLRSAPASNPRLQGARAREARYLFITFSSDWLFPTYQTKGSSMRCAPPHKHVSYDEIPSPYGHDAFLLEP